MSKKDPAFLFYPQRWLQGTAKMMPEEKGIYIDLLSHQHQDGFLPNNTKRLARMVGMSEFDFLKLWEAVKVKFVTTKEGNLVNQTLTNLVNERSTNAQAKKINGTFASVVRLHNCSQELKEKIKSSFDYTEFLDIGSDLLTNRLTIWFELCLKSIINISIDKKEDKKEGAGERKGEWNKFPTIENLNGLPDTTLNSTKEFVRIIQQKDLSNKDVIDLWQIFKHQTLTGKKFYAEIEDVYSHFLNWAKKQEFNGTKSNSASTKLGTSAARTKTAENW